VMPGFLPTCDVFRKNGALPVDWLIVVVGCALLEPAAGGDLPMCSRAVSSSTARGSCSALESRTASEMTDPRVPRLGRCVTPPGRFSRDNEGVEIGRAHV